MEENPVSRSILNIRNLTVLAIFGLMIWFLVIVRGIIGIFMFSMIIAFLLYPPVEALQRRRVPRSLAILIVFLVIFLIIGLIMLLVVPRLVEQTQNVLGFVVGQDGSSALAYRISDWSNNFIESINERFGTNYEAKELYVANQEKLNRFIADIFNRMKNFAGSVASFVTFVVAIPVICFYLLMDWPKIKTSLMKLLPPQIKDSTDSLLDQLTSRLNSYLRGQLKLSFMMFVITSLSLLILNGLGAAIPSFGFHIGPWLLLGILAGATEVIPIVGPIIAFTPAVIFGFIDGPITGITVILLYAVIQMVEGNILVPKIMGDKLDVHPLTVMFAILCGGVIGGFGGILLALPTAAVLKVLFERYYPGFITSLEYLLMESKKENTQQSKEP